MKHEYFSSDAFALLAIWQMSFSTATMYKKIKLAIFNPRINNMTDSNVYPRDQ
jgi:hypothetical protein